MKTEKDKTPLCLILDVSGSDGFAHINGFIRADAPHTEYGFDSLYSHPYQNVIVSSQTSKGTDHLYGWDLGSDPMRTTIRLFDAERIVKTLKPLEAKLRKLDDTEGAPKSFGQWINRVCRITGIVRVILRDNYTLPRDAERQERTPGNAVYMIDQCAARLVAKMNPDADQKAA